MTEDRQLTLLLACYKMLKAIHDAPCVVSPFDLTIHYDGADCDGYCLMEDIKLELTESGVTV